MGCSAGECSAEGVQPRPAATHHFLGVSRSTNSPSSFCILAPGGCVARAAASGGVRARQGAVDGGGPGRSHTATEGALGAAATDGRKPRRGNNKGFLGQNNPRLHLKAFCGRISNSKLDVLLEVEIQLKLDFLAQNI